MRRSGSPILEKYRSTKRKKCWLRQRNPAEVGSLWSCFALDPGPAQWVVLTIKRGRRSQVHLKVFSCPTLHFTSGETKAQLESHVPGSQGSGAEQPGAWGLGLPAQGSLHLGILTGGKSGLLPGSPRALRAALLSHCFTFWKQAFLFYLESLILNWPHLSYLVFILIIGFGTMISTRLCFHWLWLKSFFLLSSPLSAPRELMTIVPQTYRSQGGWPPGQLWLWSRRGLWEGRKRPQEQRWRVRG